MGLLKQPKNYRKAVKVFKYSNHTFSLSKMPNIRQKCDTNLKMWAIYHKATNKLHQVLATRLKKILATHRPDLDENCPNIHFIQHLPKFCKESLAHAFTQFSARNGLADGRYRLRPSLAIANPALQMLPLRWSFVLRDSSTSELGCIWQQPSSTMQCSCIF